MTTEYLSALQDLARRYGLNDLYVFGSRAKEIAARVKGHKPDFSVPESDVDMAVQQPPGSRLTAREKVEITQALEDLFQVRRVDLVVLSEAGPFLALDIIKGELLYSEDLDRQAEEELYILRRAGDLAPYERERRRMILEGEG